MMKTLKLIVILLMMVPMMGVAQKSKSGKKAKTEQTVNKYPLFNETEAANIWKRWRSVTPFSQEEYGRALDICIISLDYLNTELQNIVDNNPSQATRKKLATDLDQGQTSEMALFLRTFSNRFQNLSYEGQLSEENRIKTQQVIEKKAEYRKLNDLIYH